MKIDNKEVKLGDVLVSLKTGLNPRDNFKLNSKDATNWYITVRELNGVGVDFLSQTDRVNNSGLKLINNRSNLEVGDVLFSGTGTIGKTAIIAKHPFNWNIKEGVYALKPNKELLDSYYLLCLLQYFTKLNIFNRLSAGSTVFSVPMQGLANLKINLPALVVQQQLSRIIKGIDDKIERNNRINAELESMAKTLYDYWFVQFDFPDKNNKPYKTSGGKMVWDKELKRDIPEGWKVNRIGEVATVKAGGDKPENYSIEKTEFSNIPIYSNGITNDGLYGYTNKPIISEQSVTISARGTIGFCVLRNKPFVPIIRLIVLTPNLTGSAKYFFEVLKHFNFENSGSVQQQLTVPQVKDIKLLYPNEDILKKFDDITSPMKDRIEIIKEENQTLASLRDWLLPMLMNGQVKVNDINEDALPIAAESIAEYKTR